MTESKNERIAIFRFGVICEFVGGARLDRDQRRQLMRDKCQRKWTIPYSSSTRISRSTIYRWIRRYQASSGKIESLYPRQRADQGKMRRLDDETVAVIVNERAKRPERPVSHLLEALKRQGVVPQTIGLTTIYRLLHKHELMHPSKAEDRRKFEAAMANDIWQSDVMHGPKVPVGPKQRKSYLIAFLDDHSRLIVHAAFYLSENLVPLCMRLKSRWPNADCRSNCMWTTVRRTARTNWSLPVPRCPLP